MQKFFANFIFNEAAETMSVLTAIIAYCQAIKSAIRSSYLFKAFGIDTGMVKAN